MSPETFRPSATMHPAVDTDEFLDSMSAIAEKAMRQSGYRAAVKVVHVRLPNCPDVCGYTDWLLERAGIELV